MGVVHLLSVYFSREDITIKRMISAPDLQRLEDDIKERRRNVLHHIYGLPIEDAKREASLDIQEDYANGTRSKHPFIWNITNPKWHAAQDEAANSNGPPRRSLPPVREITPYTDDTEDSDGPVWDEEALAREFSAISDVPVARSDDLQGCTAPEDTDGPAVTPCVGLPISTVGQCTPYYPRTVTGDDDEDDDIPPITRDDSLHWQYINATHRDILAMYHYQDEENDM